MGAEAPRQAGAARTESRRLHMLSHMPRRATGSTGTGRCARMRSTPPRNGAISPSAVSAPSGKMPTTSPAASAASISAKARSIRAGSSFAGAIGMARAVRKIQLSTGMRKILWYITKRIGRFTQPPTISASM